MTKIVYNGCYGGFSLSHAGIMRFAELKGIKLYPFVDTRDSAGRLQLSKQKAATEEDIKNSFLIHYCTTPEYSNDTYWNGRDIERHDPALVQAVEELGTAAHGAHAKLLIEELTPGTQYRIDEYDGFETVATRDSYDWKTA